MIKPLNLKLLCLLKNLVTERLKGIDRPPNTTPASNSLETNRTCAFQSRKYGSFIMNSLSHICGGYLSVFKIEFCNSLVSCAYCV